MPASLRAGLGDERLDDVAEPPAGLDGAEQRAEAVGEGPDRLGLRGEREV